MATQTIAGREIQIDEEGDKAFVKAQRDGYEEDVDLGTWLEKEWLTSDTGKTFAPADGGGGSGIETAGK